MQNLMGYWNKMIENTSILTLWFSPSSRFCLFSKTKFQFWGLKSESDPVMKNVRQSLKSKSQKPLFRYFEVKPLLRIWSIEFSFWGLSPELDKHHLITCSDSAKPKTNNFDRIFDRNRKAGGTPASIWDRTNFLILQETWFQHFKILLTQECR